MHRMHNSINKGSKPWGTNAGSVVLPSAPSTPPSAVLQSKTVSMSAWEAPHTSEHAPAAPAQNACQVAQTQKAAHGGAAVQPRRQMMAPRPMTTACQQCCTLGAPCPFTGTLSPLSSSRRWGRQPAGGDGGTAGALPPSSHGWRLAPTPTCTSYPHGHAAPSDTTIEQLRAASLYHALAAMSAVSRLGRRDVIGATPVVATRRLEQHTTTKRLPAGRRAWVIHSRRSPCPQQHASPTQQANASHPWPPGR